MSQSSELPRKGLRVSAFAEFAFDLLTAAVSLADVAADVAVCLDFWSSERLGFFAVSMAIFGLAQASYAFLFVVAFGSHLSNCRKLVTLFIALPFSQLVPVFTMLESLHLDRVSSGLTRLGLRPTRELSTTVTPSGVDSVWTLVHRKFHAHMGFLVEAIVEAIPQCALQVSAVVLSGEASALALLSILLSLTVIASKGWIAAYSLHVSQRCSGVGPGHGQDLDRYRVGMGMEIGMRVEMSRRESGDAEGGGGVGVGVGLGGRGHGRGWAWV